MKKFLSLTLALACCASVFAGCGGASSSAPAASSAASSGSAPAEIRVVTSYGGDDGNRVNFENAVKAYEEATGNTVVDESATSNEQWKAQVKADFQTGSEPDVLFFFTGVDANEFIKNNKVVSIFSTIIPVFRMENAWGIVNTGNIWLTRLSVILPQIAGNLSFAIIVLMGFIRSLPIDLEEAAYLEGYSVFRIFFKIIMPLARPSFATVGIFTFLWSYNDLFTQMFFLRSKKFFTITRLLNEISSQAGTNYGLMVAAVVMVVIPVLVVYVFLQKNIIKGLTAGAVKG
ncbi:MAG: ABC transporter permease subunit [Pygmaiobacter massiliensis]